LQDATQLGEAFVERARMGIRPVTGVPRPLPGRRRYRRARTAQFWLAATDAGVLIWVRTNGVHAALVLPAQPNGIDWHRVVPSEHVREPALAEG
jgi:hypothetical protein